MKKKSILACVASILIIIVIIFGIYIATRENKNNHKETLHEGRLPETKVNESSILSETHKYGNLNFTGFVINYIDNIYTIFVKITNAAEINSTNQKVFIVLYDKKGNQITKINASIDSIKPNESYVLSIETKENIFSTYNYEILENK